MICLISSDRNHQFSWQLDLKTESSDPKKAVSSAVAFSQLTSLDTWDSATVILKRGWGEIYI